jgi:hypothetical protein
MDNLARWKADRQRMQEQVENLEPDAEAVHPITLTLGADFSCGT